MKVLINYADKLYRSTQKYCTKTAYSVGGFDKVIEYCPEDIDSDFRLKNKIILNAKRGGGYWLWKPYFLKKTLETLNYGDYLFYCDSGAYFIHSIDILIECLNKTKQDIMIFESPYLEKQWTKRDIFLKLDCDYEKYTDTNQIIGTYFLIKKTKFTENFILEYLKYCTDESLISDNENMGGLQNYNCFIDNRHDQSILSVLSKKIGIKSFKDISQFGRNNNYNIDSRVILNKNSCIDCMYPIIIISHRQKLVTFRIRFKWFLFCHLPVFILSFYRKVRKLILSK